METENTVIESNRCRDKTMWNKEMAEIEINYRKISNIRRAKSQNLNVSLLDLQLSLRNILKPGVKWSMKM